MHLCIVDLDKVVADSSARFERATRSDGRINWKKALDPEQVHTDTLIEGADTTLDLIAVRGYSIVFLTGRTEAMREATLKWLYYRMIAVAEKLVMRPDGDFTRAGEFKRREIERLVREYEPSRLLWIDDLVVDNLPLANLPVDEVICYSSLADYLASAEK